MDPQRYTPAQVMLWLQAIDRKERQERVSRLADVRMAVNGEADKVDTYVKRLAGK